MNVGIRELKAHLSEYVRRAAGGEHILVTHRGKPARQPLWAWKHVDGRPRGRGRMDHPAVACGSDAGPLLQSVAQHHGGDRR